METTWTVKTTASHHLLHAWPTGGHFIHWANHGGLYSSLVLFLYELQKRNSWNRVCLMPEGRCCLICSLHIRSSFHPSLIWSVELSVLNSKPSTAAAAQHFHLFHNADWIWMAWLLQRLTENLVMPRLHIVSGVDPLCIYISPNVTAKGLNQVLLWYPATFMICPAWLVHQLSDVCQVLWSDSVCLVFFWFVCFIKSGQ